MYTPIYIGQSAQNTLTRSIQKGNTPSMSVLDLTLSVISRTFTI